MLRQEKYVRASLCHFAVMPWKNIRCITASSSVILSVTQIKMTDLKKWHSRDRLKLWGETALHQRHSDVLSWQCELKHIRRETITDSVVIKSIVQSPSYRGSDKKINYQSLNAEKRDHFLIQKPYLSIQHFFFFFYTNMTLFAYKCWFCCNWSSCVWAIVPCSISLMPCH